MHMLASASNMWKHRCMRSRSGPSGVRHTEGQDSVAGHSTAAARVRFRTALHCTAAEGNSPQKRPKQVKSWRTDTWGDTVSCGTPEAPDCRDFRSLAYATRGRRMRDRVGAEAVSSARRLRSNLARKRLSRALANKSKNHSGSDKNLLLTHNPRCDVRVTRAARSA